MIILFVCHKRETTIFSFLSKAVRAWCGCDVFDVCLPPPHTTMGRHCLYVRYGTVHASVPYPTGESLHFACQKSGGSVLVVAHEIVSRWILYHTYIANKQTTSFDRCWNIYPLYGTVRTVCDPRKGMKEHIIVPLMMAPTRRKNNNTNNNNSNNMKNTTQDGGDR